MNKIFALFFFCACFGWSCLKSGDDEIHLIPDGFTGTVVIIFNQPDGIPQKWERGRRVYEIPVNGILKTQFSFNKGLIDDKYYYINAIGQRKEIPFTWPNERKISPDSIQVFSGTSGTAISDKTKREVPYVLYIVGRLSDSEKLNAQKNSLNVGDLL